MKTLKLKFESPGVQSYAYYLTELVEQRLKNKDTGGLSSWEFIQTNADLTLNLSNGICYDSPEFFIRYDLDGEEGRVLAQDNDEAEFEGIDDSSI